MALCMILMSRTSATLMDRQASCQCLPCTDYFELYFELFFALHAETCVWRHGVVGGHFENEDLCNAHGAADARGLIIKRLREQVHLC